MKRLLPLAVIAAALSAGVIQAAPINGSVGFLTKRGQRPTMSETLVWLEPVGAKNLPRRPAETVAMVTRNKTLIPHIIAIPVGSSVTFPNDDPISHNLFSLSSANVF